jgi:putative holliday junction resolvase
MRILGLDYGTKRIGVAVSDESQMLARELDIVPAAKIYDYLSTILQEYEIEKIVIGLPLNMSGQSTEKTREAEQFAQLVAERCQVPVDMMDERLSTSMAQQITHQSSQLDSLAAQIILQNYLNKQKSIDANLQI